MKLTEIKKSIRAVDPKELVYYLEYSASMAEQVENNIDPNLVKQFKNPAIISKWSSEGNLRHVMIGNDIT